MSAVGESKFPTANQIAVAVVTACRLHRENPLEIADGGAGLRGRHVAYAALCEAFDGANKRGIARCLGYPIPSGAASGLISARKARWWDDGHVDEIVGALVAELYGEQSE